MYIFGTQRARNTQKTGPGRMFERKNFKRTYNIRCSHTKYDILRPDQRAIYVWPLLCLIHTHAYRDTVLYQRTNTCVYGCGGSKKTPLIGTQTHTQTRTEHKHAQNFPPRSGCCRLRQRMSTELASPIVAHHDHHHAADTPRPSSSSS